MICFSRLEFNRYEGFLNNRIVRASLEWKGLCDVGISIPPLEVQKRAVATRHIPQAYKRLNTALKEQLQNLYSVLIRGVFEALIVGEKGEIRESAL